LKITDKERLAVAEPIVKVGSRDSDDVGRVDTDGVGGGVIVGDSVFVSVLLTVPVSETLPLTDGLASSDNVPVRLAERVGVGGGVTI
jgi:hypothetical protein